MSTDTDIDVLSNALIDEIFNALGLSPKGWARRELGWIFSAITRRFAHIGVTFDHLAAEKGFSQAAAWALTLFCKDVSARGVEHVPRQGPLLVVSNHPGAYDALVITSNLGRDDVKFISSNIPFLKNLPHICRNFLFLSPDTHDRTLAARGAVRHLQAGGAVLLYATGQIDPDPAVFPDAGAHIDRWSPSIELFLRRVPQAQLMLTVVSGVMARGWAYSPLTWLRPKGMERRRLAEFGQVMQQLLFPGRIFLSPQVSFAAPFQAADLRQPGADGQSLLPTIIARGRALLEEHCHSFGVRQPLSNSW